MSVLARLKVTRIDKYETSQRIRMDAVYSGDPDSPNYTFSQATPYAELHMGITNPAAFDQFEEGKEYDLVFSPAPAPAPEPKPKPEVPAEAEAESEAETIADSDVSTLASVTKAALLLVCLLSAAFTLAACSAIEAITPPAPKTAAQAVYEVKAGFVAAEDAALAFAKQYCPDQAACTDPRVAEVANGLITADTAIAAAEATVNDTSTDTATASAAAIAAQNALTAFQAILTQYGIKVSATTGST